MPSHHFVCRGCGDKEVLTASVHEPTPNHPYCNTCRQRYAKVFGFKPMAFPIEIHSPNVGKHGSQRSYNTARDRLAAQHTERTGMEVKYDSFDLRDNDKSPVNPS